MTDPLLLRGLPCSIEAEKMILGVIINRSLEFSVCRAVLSADDFALEAHRTIYKRMEDMWGHSTLIDCATVAQSLRNHDLLDSVGGVSALISLDDETPRLPHVDEYIKTVKGKSILRKTVIAADGIRNRAIMCDGEPEELLAQAQSMLVKLGLEASSEEEYSTPGDVIREFGLDGYLDGKRESGISTGYGRLDQLTRGIKAGELWMLGGYTSTGKSTFARNIGMRMALRNEPGALISLEMGSRAVTDGWLCALGQIDSQQLRAGIEAEIPHIRSAALKLSNLPLYIRDRSVCSIVQLQGSLRKLKQEKGLRWAIIDYLQLMQGTSKRGNRREEVEEISRGLKVLAGDLDIGILALSQFSRQEKGGKRRPMLSDFRESGSIEQDADVALLIHTEVIEADMAIYPVEVILAKNRSGPTGSIQFGFSKAHGIFREMDEGR